MSNLIRGSRWHLERLHIQHETLVEAIQKFSAGQPVWRFVVNLAGSLNIAVEKPIYHS